MIYTKILHHDINALYSKKREEKRVGTGDSMPSDD